MQQYLHKSPYLVILSQTKSVLHPVKEMLIQKEQEF